MVDGIDANRRKWQELCSSFQQSRKVSVSKQSAESDQSPECHEDAKTNQQPESTEPVSPVENSRIGSKFKCEQGLRCGMNKDSRDNQPASAGNTTFAGKK